jgi:hypothetical protein
MKQPNAWVVDQRAMDADKSVKSAKNAAVGTARGRC